MSEKKKKYTCYVEYYGTFECEVYATSEDEAEDLAERQFDSEAFCTDFDMQVSNVIAETDEAEPEEDEDEPSSSRRPSDEAL